MAAFDTINNGTHGRYTLPVGMVLNLAPTANSLARATSSVAGFGPWGPTATPIQIGPLAGITEVIVEVLQGTAVVDISFPAATPPPTVSVRTAPQLASAPTAADIALGLGALFVGPDNILRYIKADNSAFVAVDIVSMVAATSAANASASAAIPSTQKGAANGVSTLGADSKVPNTQLAGKLALADLSDGASQAAAILSAVKTPTNWVASAGGGTPALTSGTAVLGSSYKNTTAGTTTLSPAIDGIGQVSQGDLLVCLTAGTYTYFPNGGAYLGAFATVGALPAATGNTANFALVGATFYQCNGTTWAPMGGGSALPISVAWATMWDTASTKDMGEFSISAALALTSSDASSVVGGYTQAVLIADGTNSPTADGSPIAGWVNTAGARNRIILRRTGNSKAWEAGSVTLKAVVAPVAANITSAPVLGAATPGSAVTWTAGTVTGTPAPTVTYSLKKNGTVVSSPATSGAYSSTIAGDVLIVTQAATNAAYGGGTATPVDSAPVTVVTASFSDNFNRANELLSASPNWTLVGTGATASVSSNSLGCSASGNPTAYLSPDLASQNQSVSVDTLGKGGHIAVQLTDGNNYVGLRLNGSTSVIEVVKVLTGTLTIQCAFAETTVATDVVEIRYTAGTLVVKKNGTVLTPTSGSLTVAAGLPASTRTGIAVHLNNGLGICDNYVAAAI